MCSEECRGLHEKERCARKDPVPPRQDHEYTPIEIAHLLRIEDWPGTRVDGEVRRFRASFMNCRDREPAPEEYWAAGEGSALRAKGWPTTPDYSADFLPEAPNPSEGAVDIRSGIYGGTPCVVGTRFPVSNLLAEVADSAVLDELAEDFDQDPEGFRKAIRWAAYFVDRVRSPETVTKR